METVKPSLRPAAGAILPAAPADEGAIRALLQAAGLPHEDFAAHLSGFLVARQGSETVGAVGFERHGTDALLRSLVVVPARRRTGLGDRLVRAVLDQMRSAGIARVYLLTTTAETFFAQRGFQRVERSSAPAALQRTPEFQNLCPASAVCLARVLAA